MSELNGIAPVEVIGDNPAVQVAQEGDEESEIFITSSGYRVRKMAVPDSLMQRVGAKIKKPKVPLWYNPDKERDEPNPNDPDYIEAVNAAVQERGNAILDAAIMFGCELLDGLPEDRMWIKKLKILGIDVDESDPVELEFAFKKYVVFANGDDAGFVAGFGMSEKDVSEAGATFRRGKKRRADRDGQPETSGQSEHTV